MSYIPKYIIKRMFPKKKCLGIAEYDGDTWVRLMMVNVISPIEVPEGEIDLGDVELPEKVGDIIKIKVNGIDVPASEEILRNDVLLFAEGKKLTWKSIFEDHEAGGMMIPVGGTLKMLFRKSAFPEEVQDLMKEGKEVEVNVKTTIDGTEITAQGIVQDLGEFDPEG